MEGIKNKAEKKTKILAQTRVLKNFKNLKDFSDSGQNKKEKEKSVNVNEDYFVFFVRISI